MWNIGQNKGNSSQEITQKQNKTLVCITGTDHPSVPTVEKMHKELLNYSSGS